MSSTPDFAMTPPCRTIRTVTSGRHQIDVLEIAGEIDAVTVDSFRSVLAGAVRPQPHSGGIVLDLSAVSFIGAAGLHQLIRFARRVDAAGIRWALTAGRVLVRPLAALGLSEDLPIAPDVTAAIAAVVAQPAPPAAPAAAGPAGSKPSLRSA